MRVVLLLSALVLNWLLPSRRSLSSLFTGGGSFLSVSSSLPPDEARMLIALGGLAGYEALTAANRTCPLCTSSDSCPVSWRVASNTRDGYDLFTYGPGELISAACLSASQSGGRFFEESMSDWVSSLLLHTRLSNDAPWAAWLLDVGSNIGVHTLHSAASGAHVIAFEANPATAVRIRCSVARNGFGARVHVFNAAVQDHGGPNTRCINSPRDYNEGMAFVTSDCAADVAPVPTHTLDDFFAALPRSLPAPAVFKLDVEGFEVLVLRGARRWLESVHPATIVFELNIGWLARAGQYAWTEAASILTDLGYSVWIPSPSHSDMLGPPLTIKELSETALSGSSDSAKWTPMDRLNAKLAACEYNVVASIDASGFSVPVPRDFCVNRRRQ